MSRVRLGTRGSALALRQADTVKTKIKSLDPSIDVEIVTVRTSGDKGDRTRLGAFVGELQTALLDGRVDVALHCLKDLPTTHVEGTAIAAHLQRDAVDDAFVTKGADWRALAAGSVIGTGSLRRTAQIRRLCSGVEFRPLVGNIDTRLRKLGEGEYDAIVIAVAGLDRMGWSQSGSLTSHPGLTYETISVEQVVPAVGQGVLVLEVREDDASTNALAHRLNDGLTETCARSERAFLGRFGTGCSLPIGALARKAAEGYSLIARVVSPDGETCLDTRVDWREGAPEDAGLRAAKILIDQGAIELLGAGVLDR